MPDPTDGAVLATGDYDVVLLVEQALTEADARQVRSLHEGIEEPVTYHVLLPVEDAATRVQAAMSTMTTPDSATGAGLPTLSTEAGEIADLAADEAHDRAGGDLAATLAALAGAGASATGELVAGHPVDELAAKVKAVDGREAIILTEPHVVAEFFRLDWSSQARRRIGVPVLHLLEHETFDEQAGGGEGASLI